MSVAITAIKRSDLAHLVVWRRVYGPIPQGPDGKPLQVDHKCDVTLCQRPDHLRVLTGPDNTKRRGPTRGPNKRAARPRTETSFALALFERVDRPQLQAKALSLDELRQLLNRFEVLADKRRGHCWSPTRYAAGARTRSNVGVVEVSALVFDCDRVPPDPERLAGVYWLGHTTWSHTSLAPRWRVVLPLASPDYSRVAPTSGESVPQRLTWVTGGARQTFGRPGKVSVRPMADEGSRSGEANGTAG